LTVMSLALKALWRAGMILRDVAGSEPDSVKSAMARRFRSPVRGRGLANGLGMERWLPAACGAR